MAYRSDVDALSAREETLARELAAKEREHATVKQLLADARSAELSEARERDVMVGRRSLRRLALGLVGLLVAGATAGVLVVSRHARALGPTPTSSKPAPRDEVRFGLALGARGLTSVVLEPRWLSADGFATAAELDDALGFAVPAWEPFSYARDAGGRLAVASEPFRIGGAEPGAEFVTDGHGGLWRVAPSGPFVATGDGRWTRRVWLVPLGSSFRGDIEIPIP